MADKGISATKVIDPVCGMSVLPEQAAGSVEHQGVTYYFCSKSCVQRFAAAPEKYLHPDAIHSMDSFHAAPAGLVQLGAQSPAPAKPATSEPQAGVYVCPMDPEVHESKPGACPICGMALEREQPAAPSRVYVCPMHTEIVRDQPGACPIC